MKRNVLSDDSASLDEEVYVSKKKRSLYIPESVGDGDSNKNAFDNGDNNEDNYDVDEENEDGEVKNEDGEDGDDYMDYPVDETNLKMNGRIDGRIAGGVPAKSLLDTATPSIGLLMMQKMGFKRGESLGKPNSLTKGIKEPIEAVVCSGWLGIGANNGMLLTPAEAISESDLEAYRKHLHEVYTNSQKEKLKLKLQKVAMEITEEDSDDAKKNSYLWASYIVAQKEKQDALENISKIIEIKPLVDKVEESDKNDGQQEIKDDEDIDSFIVSLITYLRTHNYCFFCGTFYKDQQEMRLTCPGVMELDHT